MEEKDIVSIVFLSFYFSMFILWIILLALDEKKKKQNTEEFDEELLRRSWQYPFTYEDAMRKHCLELSQMMRREGRFYNKKS